LSLIVAGVGRLRYLPGTLLSILYHFRAECQTKFFKKGGQRHVGHHLQNHRNRFLPSRNRMGSEELEKVKEIAPFPQLLAKSRKQRLSPSLFL
jgi:hypothetical protein